MAAVPTGSTGIEALDAFTRRPVGVAHMAAVPIGPTGIEMLPASTRRPVGAAHIAGSGS